MSNTPVDISMNETYHLPIELLHLIYFGYKYRLINHWTNNHYLKTWFKVKRPERIDWLQNAYCDLYLDHLDYPTLNECVDINKLTIELCELGDCDLYKLSTARKIELCLENDDVSIFNDTSGRFPQNMIELTFINDDMTDIIPLCNLVNLEFLNISCNPINDISSLNRLFHLREIYMSGTLVVSVEPLRHLTNLTTLYLSDTPVENIEPLSRLTNLTMLSLYNTNISNIWPLQNMVNLKSLYMSDTLVASVAPLNKLTNMVELRMSFTHVTDVSPLLGCTGLRFLAMTGSPVTNASCLWDVKGLNIC